MPRRDFITPSTLPSETYQRCILIPASQEWLGLVNAALLMLTEGWRYEQIYETSLTPEQSAAAAYTLYVQYLEGACGLECCPLRINPFNGRLQQSSDDGLTWFDVDDGPWTESLYPPFSAMPLPRPEATDAEKTCAAALTAAYVLRNLYTQTGNTLLNVVAATDWEYAGALGAMLQGFLMVIGAAAVQPFVALASLLGVVGVRQQYVDYPLDNDDEDLLMCILLDNATLQASGAVTFDFQSVWDAINLDSPKNGLVRFLLTMIGPDALNYAGAVDADLGSDCSACEETWCCIFDFSAGLNGFTIMTNNVGTPFGVLGGGGVTGTNARDPNSTGAAFHRVILNKTGIAAHTLTRAVMTIDYTFGFENQSGFPNTQTLAAGGVNLVFKTSDYVSGTDVELEWVGSRAGVTSYFMQLISSVDVTSPFSYGGVCTIKSLRLEGTGPMPCVDGCV